MDNDIHKCTSLGASLDEALKSKELSATISEEEKDVVWKQFQESLEAGIVSALNVRHADEKAKSTESNGRKKRNRTGKVVANVASHNILFGELRFHLEDCRVDASEVGKFDVDEILVLAEEGSKFVLQ
uniref:Uncharacterized protein n=1 Tax=Mucochytrium quahogii TaxID=96639 RepID=A0A7S2RDU8_9STRA|mmetsp:Transcript_5538/g.8598  ORF Transcript_5538/g.8598 Transcript_5538/m.8598 type:complete len:128 (+) Transcript_5538:282-665(+)|eukprot:CAMPEP_0203763284 /NCGR_PEP_ID=MMETSP0098-20131031/15964_1 /ASSEMBLY_ACC=CAM_ASM_000208 /TAXON_ID=96639 /ORGANISM=" , Strain NY0313808BC1" /LENGTH=127 /DNA_ID=CAMNT_0050657955 /DNA_START=517 /DNA_END=900 /DNA_ORIENTATION=-